MGERIIGVVKTFNYYNGTGMIVCQKTELEYYVEKEDIRAEGIQHLKKGEQVILSFF